MVLLNPDANQMTYLPFVDLSTLTGDSVHSKCLLSWVIFDKPKEAGDFPWQEGDRLDVLGWDPDDVYKGRPNIGQESDQVRIIIDQSSPHSRTESSTYWPVTVAVLLECDLEKLQFIMQAALVAQSSDLVHQGGNHRLLIGR